MKPCILIFGFGYTASAFAQQLSAQNYEVVGTKRRVQNSLLTSLDFPVKLIDFDCPNMTNYIYKATHVLVCIPPQAEQDIVLAQYGELIKYHAPHLQWLGYLSSTGVYGDHQGEWVEEASSCIPHTPVGIARLAAEKSWYSFAKANQLPLHIFRLSGIYGRNRSVFERMQQGNKQCIYKENQVFCRVHIDDIVATLQASIRLPNPLSIYNISDDEPAPAHEVDYFAFDLLKQQRPPLVPFSKARLSPMAREFYSNNRRVSNLKIKQELKISLKYPTYREGLAQVFEALSSKEMKD